MRPYERRGIAAIRRQHIWGIGAGERTRTLNLLITSELRYHCATPAYQNFTLLAFHCQHPWVWIFQLFDQLTSSFERELDHWEHTKYLRPHPLR